jgi:hypothetical protein
MWLQMCIARCKLARQKHVICYPQFAHSSFRFAGNPDKVGCLSSPFFTHVIQTCVTRRWNLLTCKANGTSFFFISFISACYMFWLCGPSSGIKIHDCKTQNCWQQYICMSVLAWCTTVHMYVSIGMIYHSTYVSIGTMYHSTYVSIGMVYHSTYVCQYWHDVPQWDELHKNVFKIASC